MCIHYQVDPGSGVLGIAVTGLVTDQELTSCVGRIVTDSGIHPGMNVILDMRRLRQSTLSPDGIDRALRVLSELGGMGEESRLAILDRDGAAPRIDVIQILSGRFCAELRVCSDLDEVRSWLDLPETQEVLPTGSAPRSAE